MTPKTRKETFLAKAAGDDVSIPSPITREEVYLNALATGEAEGLPDPITREEVFLKAAAEGGGGEKYPTGTINFQIHGEGYDAPVVTAIAITCVGGSMGAMNISSRQNLTIPIGSGTAITTIDNVLMPEEGSYAHITPEQGYIIQVISGDAEQYGKSVKVYGECTLDISREANYKSKLMQVVDRTVTEITAADLAGTTKIGDYAFYSCLNLTRVSIPENITYIGSSAFQNCVALRNVSIPSGITTIRNYVFSSCIALASITLPSGLTTIDASAFANCSGLTSVVIPSGVTSIGFYAFTNCTTLSNITVEATTPPTLSEDAFNNTHADLVIYVPTASVSAYQSATGWSDYASKIQAIPNS